MHTFGFNPPDGHMRVAVCVVADFTAFVDPDGGNEMNRTCRHTTVLYLVRLYGFIIPGTLHCVI